jgi:penicillin-binding protein 1C
MTPPPTPSRLRRLRRLAARAARLALGAAVALLLGAYIASRCIQLPEALLQPPDTTLTLEDRSGREFAVVASRRAREAEAVTLAEMGRWLPQVTVGLEDRNFWTHNGVDAWALGGALRRNLCAWRVISGGSTIAQQLIKNTRPRTGWRWYDKGYEALAALQLTRTWPKERILEEYLNRIDYGNRRVGPRAAARAYFGKEPADLTVAEAVFLAGLPQSPTRFNPWSRPGNAAVRYRRSLAVLGQRGVLDAATLAALGGEAPALVRRRLPNGAPHFVDAVVARWPQLRGRVRTTIDLPLQKTVAALVSDHVRRLGGLGVGQAAVVVIDNRDGAVLAMVGSGDYAGPDGEINGALLPRSGGSVLKPFLYVEAIERKLLTAASVLPDTPDAIRAEYVDYDPQNFDERYLGPVRVREALASSLNVPAVYTLSRVGARAFFGRLQEWGFRFPRGLHEYGAGLILGNAEPRLVDLAAAFAGIASGGRVPGWRLLEAEPELGRVVATPEATAIVADILCDDDARRRAFGRGSPLATPVRVPCKTGTSSAFRDAWTVGSTAQHTVAVWAGNFDGRPMDGTASIVAAAPLWRAVVDELLETDTGVPSLAEGAGLVAREVCRLTGRRPTAESPGVVAEWFLPGTEPAETAAAWLGTRAGRMVITLPHEYEAWCAGSQNHLGAVVEPADGLAIRRPSAGAVYVLDPALPRSQQMVPLEAAVPPGVVPEWTVNGRPVAAQPGGACLWPMEPGECVAVVMAADQSAEVHFRVR